MSRITITALLTSSPIARNNYLNQQAELLAFRKTPVVPGEWDCADVHMLTGPMRGLTSILVGFKYEEEAEEPSPSSPPLTPRERSALSSLFDRDQAPEQHTSKKGGKKNDE